MTLPLPFSSFPHLQLEPRERPGEEGQTEREVGRPRELLHSPLWTNPLFLWASVYSIQRRWDLLAP